MEAKKNKLTVEIEIKSNIEEITKAVDVLTEKLHVLHAALDMHEFSEELKKRIFLEMKSLKR